MDTTSIATATTPHDLRPSSALSTKLGLFLAALFLCLAAWTALVNETPVVSLPGVARHSLGATTVRLTSNGYLRHLALELAVSGPAVRLRLQGSASSFPEPLDGNTRFCRWIVETTAFTCHLPVVQGAQDITVAVEPVGDAAIAVNRLDFRVLRSIRTAPYSNGLLVGLGVVLLGALPIAWLLQPRLAASQWFMIALSTGFLLALEPAFTVIVLGFLVAMYQAGQTLQGAAIQRRRMLIVLLLGAVLFLFVFKYGPDIFYGIFSVPLGAYLFPLGLSYFVIRLIDTQLRWYRKELRDVGIREYLCYQLFLPTLLAGPIETINDFRSKRLTRIGRDDFAYGAGRIVIGIAKKLVIAEWLIASALYDADKGYYFAATLDPSATTPTTALIFVALVFAYAYVDFSAYSDIAIGAGRLFGHRIRENFDWPILARNLREFWRRWHMSLSGWCMNNLYFQLLLVTRSTYLPLLATMVAIGLWHDFTLGWLLWGIHHACALCFLHWASERTRRVPKYTWPVRLTGPISTVLTMGYISIGYSFVAAHDFSTATALYLKAWIAPLYWISGMIAG
jgi:alginate O-acetyltransferase complex protein AlgI